MTSMSPSAEEKSRGVRQAHHRSSAMWATPSATCFFGLASLFIAVCACAPARSAQPATVSLFPDRVIGPANRAVLGNNMLAYPDRSEYSNLGSGIWDPTRHRPEPAMVTLCKQAGAVSLRWPGGCIAHRYNWKNTVGLLSKRPNQRFGLPEFLTFCEAVGAEPMLTLAVYWGGPEDGADLVEYLNTPNDGSNPNGGTDWAAVRAGDGHPKPCNVRWIEYGNESDHGDHKGTKFTPQEYARRYLEYRKRMRAVDPNVKLGAILSTGGLLDWWNRPVLDAVGREVDFVIHHPYTPAYYRNDEAAPHDKIARVAMAAGGQRLLWLEQIRSLLRERTARDDIPLAITEYNGHFVQAKPVAYRQCLANAVNNADAIRLMLLPKYRVASAQFWQFANEYWGMVRGYPNKNEPLVKQANYLVFELINRHLGQELIVADVQCDRFSYAGGTGVRRCHGLLEPSEVDPRADRSASPSTTAPRFTQNQGVVGRVELSGSLRPMNPPAGPWQITQVEGVQQTLNDGVLSVTFDGGKDINYYHAKKTMPAAVNAAYRVKIRARAIDLKHGSAGIQVGDARGWTTTRSCAVVTPLTGTTDWTTIVADYPGLPDTKEIEILARRLEGQGPVTGRVEFGKIEVETFRPDRIGALPELTVLASRTTGSPSVIEIVLICKRLDGPLPLRLARPNGFTLAQAECLTAPAPWSTNLVQPDTVKIVPLECPDKPAIEVELPPCSVTAVRFAK
ncbi:MAG: hypothetical protein JXQ73_31375 [Phycisphaerae bacterium]|nr:hypothetical protein [Phycisphaerae bacterium]